MDTALSLNPSPDTSLRTACIGKSVTRLEDAPLVRGEGCFAADVSFPHQLYMRVVRSQVAHGSIVAIDTSGAAALPGVVAVWTSADVAEVPPIPYRPTKLTGLDPYCQPILARDRVRYVGEPVAVVFATDAYIAEDAADQVWPSIEELPVQLDAHADPSEFAPGLTTEPTIIRKGYGDVTAAFAQAHAIIELDARRAFIFMRGTSAAASESVGNCILRMYWCAWRLCVCVGRLSGSKIGGRTWSPPTTRASNDTCSRRQSTTAVAFSVFAMSSFMTRVLMYALMARE